MPTTATVSTLRACRDALMLRDPHTLAELDPDTLRDLYGLLGDAKRDYLYRADRLLDSAGGAESAFNAVLIGTLRNILRAEAERRGITA
jgi:hypothetical protein